MDFNLTPEEMNMPVTYGDLTKILQSMIDGMSSGQLGLNDEFLNICTRLADGIAEVNYKRTRDLRFFISLLSDLGYGTKEKLYSHYDKWCDEFDKLNKGDKNDT